MLNTTLGRRVNLFTKKPDIIDAIAFLLSLPSNHTQGGIFRFSKHAAIFYQFYEIQRPLQI